MSPGSKTGTIKATAPALDMTTQGAAIILARCTQTAILCEGGQAVLLDTAVSVEKGTSVLQQVISALQTQSPYSLMAQFNFKADEAALYAPHMEEAAEMLVAAQKILTDATTEKKERTWTVIQMVLHGIAMGTTPYDGMKEKGRFSATVFNSVQLVERVLARTTNLSTCQNCQRQGHAVKDGHSTLECTRVAAIPCVVCAKFKLYTVGTHTPASKECKDALAKYLAPIFHSQQVNSNRGSGPGPQQGGSGPGPQQGGYGPGPQQGPADQRRYPQQCNQFNQAPF